MRLLIKFIVIAAFTGLCACSTETPSDTRPNILFIVADDLGFTDLGAFGSEIPTPNLDALAYQGVRLTNFHTDRACQQTRVMLMASTGTSASLEIREPLDSRERANRVSLNWAFLPELMQEAGYETYMTGKWDLGLQPDYTPATRGFDRSFVQLGASASHFAEVLWGNYSLYELDGELVEYADLPDDFFSTSYYTDRMIEFIESNDGESPWFAYVPYTAPHWPLQLPEDWLDRNAGKYDAGYDELRDARAANADALGVVPAGADVENFVQSAPPWAELTADEQRRYSRAQELYTAIVEHLDVHVGRLVDYLEESGQLDNTIVMFTSDHGASSGEHGQRPDAGGPGGVGGGPQVPDFVDNSFENWGRPNSFVDHGRGFAEAATAPLKGYKGNLNEGGLRAAAFIHYPRAVPQGEINGTFMTAMDVMPTFLEIAGTEHPGAGEFRGRTINDIKGRSFWPHLTGESATVHLATDSAGWAQGDTGALIRGDYKIINQAAPAGMGSTPWRLYNIFDDPGEINNLAQEQPDLLTGMIDEWETNWR